MILGNTKKIHFVGVGGIGMSGMAEFLQNHNFIISGSDIKLSNRIKPVNIDHTIKEYSQRETTDGEAIL